MNTEKIYDEKIAPLMSEVIKICQDNGIPIFAHFPLNNDECDDLACTTSAPFGKPEQERKFAQLLDIVLAKPKYAGVAVFRRDDGSHEAVVTNSEGYNDWELELIKAKAVKDGLKRACDPGIRL